MNALHKKLTAGVMCALIVALFLVSVSSRCIKNEEQGCLLEAEDYSNSSPRFSTTIERLTIESDEDFISYGFPGNGTEESPYLIDSYIVRSGFNESSDFYITNVTKHFIIQNCQTEHLGGIVLEGLNSASAILRYNEVMRINLFYPAMIRNCISIIDCSNVIIENNTCDSNVNGIIISKSNNITIANNSIMNGINEPSSDRRYCGLSISNSVNCRVYNNNFEEGGIFLDVSEEEINSILFENNTISRWVNELYLGVETPILVLRDESDLQIEVTDYGQIILINCTKVTIRNMYFNNTYVGVAVLFSDGCIIENGFAHLCQLGVLNYYSHATSYKNITCVQNVRGMEVVSSTFCVIDGLTATYSSFHEGLYIDEDSYNTVVGWSNISYNSWSTGVHDSGTNTTFSECVFEHNYIGLTLRSSTDSVIVMNQINYNKNQGIFISGTSNIAVLGNSVSFNKNYGIYITNSDSGILSTNLFFRNDGYGVFLSSSTQGFLIYRNSFIENDPSLGSSQAYDGGISNLWYNQELQSGNFWDDKGTKKIYEIDGTANSVDLFPLKDPIYYPPDSFSWETTIEILPCLAISIGLFITRRINKKNLIKSIT